MNVVFVHCHFCRGGVTQVVENQVAAITDQIGGQIALLSGGRNDGLSESTFARALVISVPEVDYDTMTAFGQQFLVDGAVDGSIKGLCQHAERVASKIRATLDQAELLPDDTVLHWHNHSLGKNVAASLIIRSLQADHGFSQLLQIHDFAEDFRPVNYANLIAAASCCDQQIDVSDFAFPRHHDIEYATLTGGDAQLLRQIGIDRRQVNVIPNSVTLGEETLPDQDASLDKIRAVAKLPPGSRWCLYPVRGIRRKNVGEFLLLSRLLSEDTYAGITLPPTTKIEADSYARWKSIGSQFAPRAVFDAGILSGVSFLENLAACDFVLSTSVAEGFGMAFLEPWLANRGVVARRLPNVVDDFLQEDLLLDRFYDHVMIPGDPSWISECRRESSAQFEQAWMEVTNRFGEAFRPTIKGSVESADEVDFATLTTGRQIQVLQKMASDAGFEKSIAQRNKKLAKDLTQPFGSETIDHNREKIRLRYSIQVTAARLLEIYQRLLQRSGGVDSREVHDHREHESLIDAICIDRPFFPCRTEQEIVH